MDSEIFELESSSKRKMKEFFSEARQTVKFIGKIPFNAYAKKL